MADGSGPVAVGAGASVILEPSPRSTAGAAALADFAPAGPVFDESAARERFLEALSAALRVALDSFDAECIAARTIQRVFRGYFTRERLAEMGYYAREIQRVFRGHLGRRRTRALIDSARASHAASLRSCAARAIQRVYRGFRSRKYVHDFGARKAYIAFVAAKGEELRAASQQALEEQLQVRSSRALQLQPPADPTPFILALSPSLPLLLACCT